MSVEKGVLARTADRAQTSAIRRAQIRFNVEDMCAFRVLLHSRQSAQRHAQRAPRQQSVYARGKAGEECRGTCQIVLLLLPLLTLLTVGIGARGGGGEGHHAESKV